MIPLTDRPTDRKIKGRGNLACISYVGKHVQGKRAPLQMTINDVNKIRNEISTLSHYARMPRKAASTAPGDDYFHLPSTVFIYSSKLLFR